MLEEIKKSYEILADFIPGWKTVDKNELVNKYIENENNEYEAESYLSAIVCRYWYNIGKYYNQSRNSVSVEECYDWLIHAITYSLEKRKWLDPNSALYKDPAGPDKCINRCIDSARRIFYQASNMDKRKINYMSKVSIDQQIEDFDDQNDYIIDETPTPAAIYQSQNTVEVLVAYNLARKDILAGIIVDLLAYGDCLKDHSPNTKKLVKELSHLSDSYYEQFKRKYNVNFENYDQEIEKIKKLTNTKLYKYIDKVYAIMRQDQKVRELL